MCYFNCRILLVLSAVAIMGAAGHAQSVLKTADYKVNQELDMPGAHLLAFRESHNLNMMGNLQWSGMVDDSLYFVALSAGKDTLYALNCYSGYLRVLPLGHLRNKQIIGSRTFHYHNHDSIFFCIRRTVVVMGKKHDRNDRDILLINGRGELLNLYSLDSLPGIYIGEWSHGSRNLWNDNLDERMFAGGFLVDAVTWEPYVTMKGFSAVNPKIMALCNLENNSIRMLNIRYPLELQEKKYDYSPEMWVKVTGPKEMLVGFTVTPYIYRYSLDMDTMVRLDVRYDGTFRSTDPDSIVKGKDYSLVMFMKPVWSADFSCYLREISLYRYKDYQSSVIVELLDSRFNHLGYVYADKKRGWQKIRCHADGTVTVADNGGYGRHSVHLTGQMRNTRLSRLERRSMEKKLKASKRALDMTDYMKRMNLPDSCVFAIINMKYPCGPCMQDLVSFYRDNRQQMENNNVYYLFYDPEHRKDNIILDIFRDHGVKETEYIRIDHHLLRRVTKVLPNGMLPENMQYMFFIRQGENLNFTLPDFTGLMSELHRYVPEKR